MRCAPGLLLAMLLLLAWAPAEGNAADENLPSPPSCAEGPTTIGETTFGTPCADLIVVAPGVEAVKGGAGDDTIVPAATLASAPCPVGCRLGIGSQTYEGGPGDDIVFGERGNDILRGGEGNDRLYGGIGDDLLEGGPGNDVLSGGFGADGIDGGPGNDYVRGDGTQDEIVDTGPASDIDTLSYSTGIAPGFTRNLPSPGNSGFPAKGGERGVYLDLGANIADDGVAPNGGGVDQIEGADFERIVGSPFSDYIAGDKPNQQIYGGGGADVLVAGGATTTLNGGADGDNCVGGAPAVSCVTTTKGGTVSTRDAGKASVGLMTSGEPGEAQVYLLGGSVGDSVSLAYLPSSLTFTLTAGTFDQNASAAAGCTVETTTKAVCPLAGPLDSVLIAGLEGNDTLAANGLPATTSLMLLGGDGNDTETGGEESDDTLVDGAGNDVLHGLGGDDALLDNEGIDQAFGEGGNDLFLSNAICNGDLLSGGEGRDNASWAKFGEGVDARLDLGQAGRPGPGGAPQCSGGSLDTIDTVEDLEGSSSADIFYGDAGPNQLLGHLGPDTYFAGAGEDSIFANSGDFDPVIDCGDDTDTAIIDRPQYGDAAADDCENVFEADPNNFRTTTRLRPAIAPKLPPVDTKPPRTRITAHPAKLVHTRKERQRVVFRFTSNERGSRFRCKLDRKPFRPCASPRAYTVAAGPHAVHIVAIDVAGNVDRTPALFRFRVLRFHRH